LSDRRFEALVEAHGRKVMNVALRVLADADLARDVYQEVFLAIWQRWRRYDDRMNWGAYLYRVTVRKAMELARRRRLVPAGMEDHNRVDISAGPDMALRCDELQRKLTASLAKLPARQAEVFVLSRMEGLDHAAIAGILGCSANNVRVSLHRALKQLAREMSSYRR
jgi:RNA polymerase sigma-70 factor (ECF subfamily)